jgi:DASH complex subunit ASK1
MLIKNEFWKQFFEASANVSLSGYEENPNGDTTEHEQTTTITEEESTTNITQNTSGLEEEASYETPSSEHFDLGHPHHNDESELDLSSLTISPSHSTPRPPSYHQKGKTAQLDETPSSSSAMGGYYPPTTYGEENSRLEQEDSTLLDNDAPVTPGRYAGRYQQSAETPMSSPFIPPPTTSRSQQPSTSKKNYYQKPTDPVLHHVLDKTYRVQATPLSKKGAGAVGAAGAGFKPTKFSVTTTPKRKPAYDDSPLSSPELEAPKLHEEIFASPMENRKRAPTTPGTIPRSKQQQNRGTPKPGISVLTPGKNNNNNSGWDSDDDEFGREFDYDDDTGTGLDVSPPKTMQFHIPQSRLMKTPGLSLSLSLRMCVVLRICPAKEASKRIVSDLLATAGGTEVSSIYDDDDSF